MVGGEGDILWSAMKKLVAASAVCSAVFLAYVIAPHLTGARWAVVFKVASIALLAVMAAVARPRRKPLILALVFSACGDLLLDVKKIGSLGPVQLFLFGLISFLVAHLFYVALFVRERSARSGAARKLACVVVVVVALVSLKVLWPGLAEMRGPVLAYSAVLTAMAVTAQRSRFGALVAIGALFFVASDTMLAMSVFGHPFGGSRVLVWVTYYAAQVMMAWGVVRHATGKSVGATAELRSA